MPYNYFLIVLTLTLTQTFVRELPALRLYFLKELSLSLSDCLSCQTGVTVTTDAQYWPMSKSHRTLLEHYEDDFAVEVHDDVILAMTEAG